jgi:hypothetical protein
MFARAPIQKRFENTLRGGLVDDALARFPPHPRRDEFPLRRGRAESFVLQHDFNGERFFQQLDKSEDFFSLGTGLAFLVEGNANDKALRFGVTDEILNGVHVCPGGLHGDYGVGLRDDPERIA